MKRIALFGADGQLGRRLHEHFGHNVIPLVRARVDLEKPEMITQVLGTLGPDAIINAAAYTDVEGAEDNPALAIRINADAPQTMAKYAAKTGIPFIHVSTDYVFDGEKNGPYTENDITNPINAYGKSKLLGESAVLAESPQSFVLRTSWLYDAKGKNFLNTIANRAREREELRVVADQVGAPCFARDVARSIGLMMESLDKHVQRGIVHMVNAGETSWHGFAEAIVAEMHKHETVAMQRIVPVPSSEYPTKARRPKNSRLSTDLLAHAFDITLPPWQDALTRCMKDYYAHR